MSKQKKTLKEIQQKKVQTASADNNALIYILLAVICGLFMYICFQVKFIQDDAFITFRYVRNLAEGNGLVYNIGERVEGYTCFLWVIVLSIFYKLGANLESTAQFLSIIFGVATLIITYFISTLTKLQDAKGNVIDDKFLKMLNLVPPLMITFTGGYTYWSISGMESTLFITFCLLGLYNYINGRNSGEINYKFPLFMFLASLTRPEGVYLFAIMILHKFIMIVRENWNEKGKIVPQFLSKNNLITYAIYIVPSVLYMLFRLWYYGYMFPNTYYAKTGLSSVYITAGLDYAWLFFKSYLLFGLVLLAPLTLFKRKEIFFETSLYYLIIVLYTLYIISVGGDVLLLSRFFIPIVPIIFLLFGLFLKDLYLKLKSGAFSKSPGFAFAIAAVIAVGIGLYNQKTNSEEVERVKQGENGLVEKMKIAGNWFKAKQVKSGKPMTIAATTIGAVSYYAGSDVAVIDMLGLTDKEIAHNPQQIPDIVGTSGATWKERNFNVPYVLSRKPEYIYFSTGMKPSAFAERGLFTSQEFLKNYYPYLVAVREEQFNDIAYKRKTDSEIAEMKDTLQQNPAYKNSYINLYTQAMNTSRDKAKIQESINLHKQAIAQGPPNFSLSYQALGDLYMQTGNKEEAVRNYEKAIEIDDYSVISHYALYGYYTELKQLDKAQSHLAKMQKYNPDLF